MSLISPLAIAAPLSHNTLFKRNHIRAMRDTTIDVDYENSVYWLGGKQVYRNAVDAFHYRSSTANARLAGGSRLEFPINSARIISGLGYQHEYAGTNLSPNGLDLINAYTSGEASVSAYGSPLLGFSNPVVVGSAGAYWHRVQDDFSATLDVNDTFFTKVLVKEGTSGGVYIELRNSTEDLHSTITGDFGSLIPTSANTGDFTNVVDADLGNGFHLVSALFTVDTLGHSWQLGVGTNSNVIGENIVIIAQDIKQANFATSIADGARSADGMIIPSADTGLNTEQGFAMIKWIERDHDYIPNNHPISLRVGDATNRVTVYREPITGRILFSIYSGGVHQGGFAENKPALGSKNTAGVTWENGSARFIANGVVFNDASVSTTSNSAQLSIGCGESGDAPSTATTQRVVAGTEYLSEAELIAMASEIAS